MKWDEFIDKGAKPSGVNYRQTGIECPDCGRHIFVTAVPDFGQGTVLMWNYFCVCGWKGRTIKLWKDDRSE